MASANPGRPRIGRELARGAEGIVYDNLDEPSWVVKEFHKHGTSPLQAQNEFANLEKARRIRPDNVVKARAPADPRQGWIVKELVTEDAPPVDRSELMQILQDFVHAGVHDVVGNMLFGHTEDNSTPRWILIE